MRTKGLFLIVSIVMILSMSSCGSKSENPGTADPTPSTETTAPLDETTSTMEPIAATTEVAEATPEPTPHFADTNGMNFREVLDTIPVRIYNRLDSDTPWEEQRETANTAFDDLQISERQLECILTDIDHRELDREYNVEELLAAIPSDIYDPSDTETPLEDQITLVKSAYNKGLLSDRQYGLALSDLEDKQYASTDHVDLFGTNPGTPHDTYIPAHGNPGVVNDATPDPDYVPPFADEEIDWSKYQNVVIE